VRLRLFHNFTVFTFNFQTLSQNSELRSRLARLLPAVPGPSPIPHIQISFTQIYETLVFSKSFTQIYETLVLSVSRSALGVALTHDLLRARLELEVFDSSSSPISTLSSRARAGKSGSTRARARARAWPNNKRAEPEQPRLGLSSARLHP
jgi:hypothetical protein